MKRTIIAFAAVAALVSCQSLKEEFQPVFTFHYDEPDQYQKVSVTPTHTIAQLAGMYTVGTPKTIAENVIVSGIVSTTDQPGNFYKSFYIQDETGGIEVKVGKNGLYNDYQPGQRVYVDCSDLTIGMYGYKTGNYGGMGMVQIGFNDPSGSYETSYIESPIIINNKILRGEIEGKVNPVVVSSAASLPDGKSDTQATNSLVGKLVTLKGLTYGKEVFVLLYLDSTKDKTSYTNRVFLSSSNSTDPTCGITTWAMSETKMKEYLYSGIWDGCKVGSGNTYLTDENGTVTLGSFRKEEDGVVSYPGVELTAYSVSQYFKMGSTTIQIRTSGFSKFCDLEIDPAVLNGTKTMDVTGILSIYQGSFQLIVNSADDFKVNN